MTVTRRILWQVALATGLVIAVSAAVTYRLVLRAAEGQGRDHLNDYVAERARVEALRFLHVQENLEMVRANFIRRIAAPAEADAEERWNHWFERFPDGAWRTRRKFSDGRKFSSGWIHRDTALTPELKQYILRAQDISNELLPGWVDSFPSLYFVFPQQVNIGFDPRIPNWVWDAAADYDNNEIESVREASPAHNPSRRIYWGPSMEEPVSKVPYVNVLLPLDIDGTNLCVVGHDIAVSQLLEDSTRSRLPGATHMIFRPDGRLIAHPGLAEQIRQSNGRFSLQANKDPLLQRCYELASAHPERQFYGYDRESDSYYAAARLVGPGWVFLTVMPRASLRAQAFHSVWVVVWPAFLSLGLVLGVFAAILNRQIARPLAELSRATARMSEGDISARAIVPARDELGGLAHSFNEMAERISNRDTALRAEKFTLSQHVAERTAELRESEERFSRTFQTSPAFIALIRLQDGIFVNVNEAFLKASGYTEAEVLGQTSMSLNLYAEPEQRDEYLRLIREHRSVRDREHLVRTKGGAVRTMLVSGELLDLDGQAHVLTVGLDITARKQAEAELVKSLERERELGELKTSFVSMVSHEFRTPLEVITSSADILERYLERLAAPERAEHLGAIQHSVKRMAGMMENVLLLGRFESDRQQFKPDDLHLAAWCRRFVDEMRSATNAKCPIELALAPDLPLACADENLLRHILTNLLTNAVKYSPPGVAVRLEAARAGTDVLLRVIDAGIGIPPADRAHLFEAFHRGGNTGQIPGTGLGLVIVKRSVELHGGTITCTSTEGRGTTFTVQLPVFDRGQA